MRLLKNLTIYYLQKKNKDIKKILSELLKNNIFSGYRGRERYSQKMEVSRRYR